MSLTTFTLNWFLCVYIGVYTCAHAHHMFHMHTVTTEHSLTFLQSSPLNTLFWKQLSEKLKELAPTEVSLSPSLSPTQPLISSPSSPLPPSTHSPPPTTPLVKRLLSSEQLSDFCRLCNLHDNTRGEISWKCFSTVSSEEEGTVCMLLIPNTFSRGEGASEEVDVSGGREKESRPEEQDEVSSATFVLPLLLLHCHLDILLDPDPAMPNPPTLLPDVFQHLTLGLSHSPSPQFSSAPPSLMSTPSPQTSLNTSQQQEPLKTLYSSLASETLCKLVSKLRALHSESSSSSKLMPHLR